MYKAKNTKKFISKKLSYIGIGDGARLDVRHDVSLAMTPARTAR